MENYTIVLLILAIMIGLSAMVVVVFTLIGQGLSLPWLVRKLKI